MILVEEGEAAAERSGLEVHPGVQEHDGGRAAAGERRARQSRGGRAGAAADHNSRSADAHLRCVVRGGRDARALQGGRLRRVVLRGRDPSRSAHGSRSWRRCRSTPQPGERYVYGFNTDILGYVVEKASGAPLDQFFATRIFEPLEDGRHVVLPARREARTARHRVPEQRRRARARAGQGRCTRARTSTARASASRAAPACSRPPPTTRASCRCCSTAASSMAARILSPTTVALMTSSHTGTLYQEGRFGFGPRLRDHRARRARRGARGRSASSAGAAPTSRSTGPTRRRSSSSSSCRSCCRAAVSIYRTRCARSSISRSTCPGVSWRRLFP